MATTVTKTDTDRGGAVIQKTVTFESGDISTPTDITIAAAVSGKKWYLRGITYGIDAAHVINIKSGSDLIASYDLGGSGGVVEKVGEGYLVFTGESEALVASSTAQGTITFTYSHHAGYSN